MAELYIAARNGDFRLVRDLLSKGADPNYTNKYGNTPLHTISCRGHIAISNGLVKEVVITLITAGANINAQNIYGNTPLHHAAQNDDYEIVNLLLVYGANRHIKNHNDRCPQDMSNVKMYEHIISFGYSY